jgi:hypothetical protein
MLLILATFGLAAPREYEYYFSQLPFNGKMYPTGLVRIYTEPNYEEVNGVIKIKKWSGCKTWQRAVWNFYCRTLCRIELLLER